MISKISNIRVGVLEIIFGIIEAIREVIRLWWVSSLEASVRRVIEAVHTGMWSIVSGSARCGQRGQGNGLRGGLNILVFLLDVQNFLCRRLAVNREF